VTTVPSQSADGVRWDLRELYDGPADLRIEGDLAATVVRAEAFAAEWRGRLTAITAPALRAALAEYEAIQQLAQRPGFYASLLTAMDSQDPVALALEQRTAEAQSELRAQLVFFELEILALDDASASTLIADPALATYAHFLTC